MKPGKGAAFVRTTLRNYVTGNTVEKTFRAGAKVMSFELKTQVMWSSSCHCVTFFQIDQADTSYYHLSRLNRLIYSRKRSNTHTKMAVSLF